MRTRTVLGGNTGVMSNEWMRMILNMLGHLATLGAEVNMRRRKDVVTLVVGSIHFVVTQALDYAYVVM